MTINDVQTCPGLVSTLKLRITVKTKSQKITMDNHNPFERMQFIDIDI